MSISTHSLQIMFSLPLMTGHLFWKVTILGGLYRGVPLYLTIGTPCTMLGTAFSWVRPHTHPTHRCTYTFWRKHISFNAKGLNKIATILQTTYSNSFSWRKCWNIDSIYTVLCLSVYLLIRQHLVQMMACWRSDRPLTAPMLNQFIDVI